MRVTLSDIADRAGVSQATVSRVLNGRPGVAAATRAAVLDAVGEQGYDGPARTGRRPGGLVGIVVPELENPIFASFASALASALAQHGCTPVVCTQALAGMHEDDYVRVLLDKQAAGVVFVSGQHADVSTEAGRYTALVERGLPMVLVNGHVDGVAAAFVSNDDAMAVDLAVGHLVQLGHRRIGLATGPRRYVPVLRRIDGFREALARHLPDELHAVADRAADSSDDALERLVECTHFTVEGGVAAAGALLDRGCTAIVCGSDMLAIGAVRGARERGLRVPEDVSVVGSDDSLLMSYTDPSMTTVRQPVLAMSAAAVSALVDALAGGSPPRAEYLFQPELVVRGSTAPAPAAVEARLGRAPVAAHSQRGA